MSALQQSESQQAVHAAARANMPRWLSLLWAAFVLGALLTLAVVPLTLWAVAVSVAALLLLAGTVSAARGLFWLRRSPDPVDLAVVAGLYIAVVALFRLAFVGFTPDNVLGLFLAFAGGLVLGVAGPVAYTVWFRRRPLRSLGLGGRRWGWRSPSAGSSSP